MENIILDETTLNSLKKEVFDHLSYVRILLRDRYFLNRALDKLNDLHQCREENFYDEVHSVYDQVCKLSNLELSDGYNYIYLHYYSIIWELVCLYAFYVHNDDSLWTDYFLPRMKAYLPNVLQKEETKGESLIQTYIASRQQLKDAILQLQGPVAKVTTTNNPTQNDLEDTFNLIWRQHTSFPIFIEELLVDREKAEDSDWARDALDIYENWKKFLKKKPATFKLWLHQFCDLFGRTWARDYEPKKLKTAQKISTVHKYIMPS